MTLEIDGSMGEGGGQLLRTALSLSAVTGRPFHMSRIRQGRPQPGLKAQHLTAVQAAAQICGARTSGDRIGSCELSFEPGHAVRGGERDFHVGTAGATSLVAQALLLPLAMCGEASSTRIGGGSHVPHAPAFEELTGSYLPALRTIGVPCRADLLRAGFYPPGGGLISLEIDPAAVLLPIQRPDRGRVRGIQAIVVTACLPDEVAARGAEAILRTCRELHPASEAVIKRVDAASPGAAITALVETEYGRASFSALGARGKRMERVAEEAGQDLRRWIAGTASCDEHLADQLVLPAALAAGLSTWSSPRLSRHLASVLPLVRIFIPIEWEVVTLEGDEVLINLRSPGLPA